MNKLLKTLMCSLPAVALYGCNGCWSPMPVVSCGGPVGEPWPPVAFYQKPATYGRTDADQRWRDVEACGGKRGDLSLRSAMTRRVDSPIDLKMREEFRFCMRSKGYDIIENVDSCGTQDPKENKGKCNL